ncbi:MAG: YbbR-like domain-containing protein [Flavobacterium sp.]|nr:YbbR-like domain-containing protein [Pedobacter sp.]
MPLIKLSKLERRRLSVFISCLVLAIGAWLFFALSNRYVYQVGTLVKYTALPQNKAFNPLQSDTVKLQVEGTGWELVFSKLRIRPQSVTVNLKDLNKRNYVTFSEQLFQINKQFETDQKVVFVQPDTLYFDFSTRSVKKVPVKVVHSIQFQPQFEISGKIKMNPEYVTVSGPFDDLLKVEVWETETLKAENVSQIISANVPLKRPLKANINIYPFMIDIKIPVDEFTEMSVDVPVKIVNNRSFRNVKLLPDKVKITFLSALSNSANINRDLFVATVDMANWSEMAIPQLPVKIGKYPDFCKIISVEPQALDYLIIK